MPIQLITDIIADSPSVTISLFYLLLMLFVVTIASIFKQYKLAVICTYFFLINGVFIENTVFASFDAVSLLTVSAFLLCGALLVLALFHHGFSR